MLPLTAQAHQRIQNVLQPGDWAIDATCGNGADTLFLAKTVGSTGRVLAIDLQPAAIERSQHLIQKAELKNVDFCCDSHAKLKKLTPTAWHSRVAAIMFNLGYLPGGDRSVITQPESTISALTAALPLLRSGGVLSVMIYPGHPGGEAELTAVREWLNSVTYPFVITEQPVNSPISPRLIIVCRAGDADGGC